MIDADQLRTRIIRPALLAIGRWSDAAENLLLLTCAAESRLGTFVAQKGGGPALGIFQMESATHDDIWANYLRGKAVFVERIEDALQIEAEALREEPERLIWDLRYATIMARVHYLRVAQTLPGAANWPALAAYWKRHYNTHLGAGTPEYALVACKSCGVLA